MQQIQHPHNSSYIAQNLQLLREGDDFIRVYEMIRIRLMGAYISGKSRSNDQSVKIILK